MRRLLSLAALLLLASCSGLRYVPAGQQLYTGSKVIIKSPAKIANQAALQTELTSVLAPKPNSSLLGLRPKLYFWHLGVGKKKGLGKFLADKLGEAPVLLKDVKISATEGLITNRLYNNGFFHGTVGHEVKAKANTAQVDYTATVGPRYLLKEIHFPEGDTCREQGRARQAQAGTLLKAGDPYNLERPSPTSGCASTTCSRTRATSTSRPTTCSFRLIARCTTR